GHRPHWRVRNRSWGAVASLPEKPWEEGSCHDSSQTPRLPLENSEHPRAMDTAPCRLSCYAQDRHKLLAAGRDAPTTSGTTAPAGRIRDRKSTRLNSSHQI